MARRKLSRKCRDILDYPFELIISIWGMGVGVMSIVFYTPTSTLSDIPHRIDDIWGMFTLFASVLTFIGLHRVRVSTILPNAMIQFAIVFLTYAIMSMQSMTAISAWVTAGMSLSLSIICVLRSIQISRLLLLLQGKANIKLPDND